MKIGYNKSAFRATANIQRADTGITKASRRLSSGLRINRSADDPAGMAISNRLLSQARGTGLASQSSSNIISALHTADGALGEIHSMLGRIQVLALAAANETLVSEDLQKIQQEIAMLIDEIDQTAAKTEYNRIRLLNGDAGRVIVTEGPISFIDVVSVDRSLPFGALSFELTALPTHTTLVTGAGNPLPNPDLQGRIITINGVSITLDASDNAVSLRTKLVQALAVSDFVLTDAPVPSLLGSIQALYSGSRHTLDISGDPLALAALGLDAAATLGSDASIANFGGILEPGTTYASDGEQLTIADTSGNTIRLALRSGVPLGSFEVITLQSPFAAQIGANTDMNLRMEIPRVNSLMLGISRINVQSQDGAQDAIAAVPGATDRISAVRAQIGAYTNRLEHVVTNLDLAEVDMRDSLSRIRDADMAMEMVEYTKNQVIYQAGMAVLAQANARPLQLLQLLS